MVECKHCGEPFERAKKPGPPQIFCSKTCSGKWRWVNDRERRSAQNVAAGKRRRATGKGTSGAKECATERQEWAIQNIYWCMKYGDKARRVELAHDLIDMRFPITAPRIIDDFISDTLEGDLE